MQGTGPARSCPGCRVLRSRELALDAAPAGLGAGDDGCVLGEEEEEEEEEGAGLSVSVDAGEKEMHGGFGCPAPNSPRGEMLLPKTLKPHVRPTSPPCLPREA